MHNPYSGGTPTYYYPPPTLPKTTQTTTEIKLILGKIWSCVGFTYWILASISSIALVIVVVVLLVYLPMISRAVDDFHEVSNSVSRSAIVFSRMFPDGDPAAVRTLFPKTEEELNNWRDKSTNMFSSIERITDQFSKTDLLTSFSVLMDNIAYFSGTKEFQSFRERIISFILKIVDLAENDPQVHIAMRSVLAWLAEAGTIEISQIDEGTIEYRIIRKIDQPTAAVKQLDNIDPQPSLTSTIISDLKGFLHRTDVVTLGSEVAKLVPELVQLASTVNRVSNSSDVQKLIKDFSELADLIKNRTEENDTQLFIKNVMAVNVSDVVQDFKSIKNIVETISDQANQTHLLTSVSKTSNITGTILNSLKNMDLWDDANIWYQQFRNSAFPMMAIKDE